MNNTIRLILTCPVCGAAEWKQEPTEDGAFECAKCGASVLVEEMIAEEEEEAR